MPASATRRACASPAPGCRGATVPASCRGGCAGRQGRAEAAGRFGKQGRAEGGLDQAGSRSSCCACRESRAGQALGRFGEPRPRRRRPRPSRQPKLLLRLLGKLRRPSPRPVRRAKAAPKEASTRPAAKAPAAPAEPSAKSATKATRRSLDQSAAKAAPAGRPSAKPPAGSATKAAPKEAPARPAAKSSAAPSGEIEPATKPAVAGRGSKPPVEPAAKAAATPAAKAAPGEPAVGAPAKPAGAGAAAGRKGKTPAETPGVPRAKRTLRRRPQNRRPREQPLARKAGPPPLSRLTKRLRRPRARLRARESVLPEYVTPSAHSGQALSLPKGSRVPCRELLRSFTPSREVRGRAVAWRNSENEPPSLSHCRGAAAAEAIPQRMPEIASSLCPERLGWSGSRAAPRNDILMDRGVHTRHAENCLETPSGTKSFALFSENELSC